MLLSPCNGRTDYSIMRYAQHELLSGLYSTFQYVRIIGQKYQEWRLCLCDFATARTIKHLITAVH